MSYEANEKCLYCGTTSIQRTYHHVKSRGAGGGDEDWNLMPLCKFCHDMVHRVGLNDFAINSNIYYWLLGKGWEFCKTVKKWIHPL